MLTRWRIKESPTKTDPHRHILMLHAAIGDVQRLIRLFGPICGRPKRKNAADGYNFSLLLHGVMDEDLERIDAQLKKLAEPESAAAGKQASSVEAPALIVLTPPPGSRTEPEGAMADREVSSAKAPGSRPEAEGAIADREVSSAKAPGSKAEPSEPPGGAPPKAAPGAQDFKGLSESSLWGTELSPAADKTFESLLVGAHNRSAHAAAMAVVTHPGTMYNPLLISGPAGTGKTHILHAIAGKLREIGGIWLTSGPKISLAAAKALRAGKADKLREKARNSKALIIDDAHLLGITEGTRELMAELVKITLESSAQVVLSSAYPARLLGSLEDALGLRIASGQAAELKFPAEPVQREILHQIFDLSGFDSDPVGRDAFVDCLAKDFAGLGASLRRLRSLKILRASLGQSVELKDLLGVVFPEGENVSTQQAAPERLDPADEKPVAPASRAESEGAAKEAGLPVAVFYPQGRDSYADWAWGRLRLAVEEAGWPFPFRYALRGAYDPKAFNVPFSISDQIQGGGPQAVLVVGPEAGSELADMEGQFRHTLERLLGEDIPVGWLRYERSSYPLSYKLAYLDMRSGAA